MYKMFFLLLCSFDLLLAADLSGDLPKKLQAVLLDKTLQNYTNSSPQISVYVVGDDGIVAELKKIIGTKIIKVDTGAGVPTTDPKPDVIFIVDASKVNEVKDYTRKNRKLSCTSNPDLIKKGISLGLVQLDGKPRIYLNSEAYIAEHVIWNPVFLNAEFVIKLN